MEKVRRVAESVFEGLSYVHSRRLIHGDISLSNIVVDDEGAAKLIDFGFAFPSSPALRAKSELGTREYCAPEGILGTPVDDKCDVYSVGVVIAELALHSPRLCRGGGPPGMPETTARIKTIRDIIGLADHAMGPIWGPKRLTDDAVERVTPQWQEFFRKTMSWRAADRPSSHDVLAAEMIPRHLSLWPFNVDGPCTFEGDRGPWSLLLGRLDKDLLDFLRGDIVFSNLCPAELKDDIFDWSRNGLMELPPTRKRKYDAQIQDSGRTFIAAGGTVPDVCTGKVNNFNAKSPLPSGRLAAFARAFNKVNETTFAKFHAAASAEVAKLEVVKDLAEGKENNGTHFMKNGPEVSLNVFGSVIFVKHAPGLSSLEQQAHFDGGASILHIGLGLWGRRRLTLFEKKAGGEKYVLDFAPGDFYLGPITSMWHQVFFSYFRRVRVLVFNSVACVSSPLLFILAWVHGCDDGAAKVTHFSDTGCELKYPDLTQSFGVTCMIRSALFPHARSRLMKNPPTPKPVFEILTRAVNSLVLGGTLRFPTVAEVQAMQTEVHDNAASSDPHAASSDPRATSA